jgi:hypothetical protein
MREPDLQRIVIVAAVDRPVETRAFKEAAQINFDQSDEVPQNDLLEAVLELVKPAATDFQERRTQTDWGATGLYIQELLLNFGAGTAAGLTVEGVIAGVRKLSRRSTTRSAKHALAEVVSQATNAEAAWTTFSRFLTKAFKVSSTMASEVAEVEAGWRIRALGDGYRYEGTLSRDGRILHARQVDDWTAEHPIGE